MNRAMAHLAREGGGVFGLLPLPRVGVTMKNETPISVLVRGRFGKRRSITVPRDVAAWLVEMGVATYAKPKSRGIFDKVLKRAMVKTKGMSNGGSGN